MVRSKFPGKPSKLINRKLTRASTASAIQENEATKTAEDINHGLKIFKGIFGFDEEDKGTEFRGFSPHEVHVARDKSRIRHIQVEEEYKARGVLYEPYSTGKTTLLPACFVNIKPIYCGRKSYNQKTSEESRLSDKKPNEPSSSSSVGKADILPVFKAPVTDSSKENRFVRTNRCNAFKVRPSIPDTQDKGGGDNKKKFVLPSRSVHSSRVIKPNKRFLDTDLNIGSSGTSDNNDAVYAGIKLKKAKLVVNPLNENSAFTWCNNKVRKEGASSSVSGVEVINNPNETRSSDSVNSGSNENPPDNNSSASAITTSSTTTITTTTTTATSVSTTTTTTITTATVTSQPGPAGGKVIIRKARLKIDNELPSLKGPFSEKFENPKHAPGTVVCGVCGAVRFYRFVKQTRKFGIYSCEACRKFISRMIRETYVSSPLQCLQGDGKCVVPLIMTTLKWTSTRNRIPRCEACWLKMCLQCYCMPEDLRDRLTEKLPKSMHEDFKLELSSKPKSIPKLEPKDKDVLSGDETSTSRQRRRAAINSLVNIARFTGRVADETVENQLLIARNLKKKATAMMRREVQMNCTSKKDLVRISEDILIKNVKADSKRGLSKNANGDFKTSGVMSAKENLNSGVISMADPQKKKKRKLKNDEKTGRRQRINIKGPRVKHVCRSASLVLGQPVATFNSAVSPLKNKANATKELDGELTMSVLPAVMETSPNADITEMVNGKPTEHSCMRMRQPCDLSLHKEEPPPAKASRALSNQSKPLARTLQDLGRQNCELLDGVAETHESAVVSIDFWESYDPEEVCKTGFALIGSDASFKARALCFLCGSAGQDRLIHCACCCEPYHQYCVEGGDCNKTEDKDWWRVDWVCPRCTLCNACGLGSGPQLSCQRCHKSYHTECLAADRLANRLHSADRPWVCPSCLRCKSCNVAAVYKFVGNLPLCRGCFKLRQRGNFCPLCQRCYEDNDFDTKMMECSQCKCWVHAKCEGLSNEKYQVLSFLPESVEFVCRMCCEMPPAPWWLAVEAEMKVGYLSVLKALSKNRKACDLLKWSPKKQSPICVCHGGARQRTLRFPELSEQSDAESSDLRTSCDTQRDEEVLSNEDECLQKSVKQNSLDSENSVILVSESKDLSVDERTSGLCELRLKYRDGPVLRPNAEEELHLKLDSDTQLLNIPYQNIDGKTAQFSPHATSQSDSGIASTDDELKSTTAEQCFCLGLDPWTKTSPTLLTVKKKVNSNEYSSLLQFHQEMQHVISSVKGLELLDLYYQTLQDVFPWFDPKCSQVYDSRKESSIAQTEFDESTESVNNERTENCDEDVSVVLRNLLNLSEDYYYSDFSASDIRVCVLCKTVGEGKATYEGRLLYCGHNEWVHANCALWSNEVFEEIDGSLQNVHSAVSRSRHIRCSGCGKKGASVGCCNRNCPEAYHFPCARAGRCVFMENKTVYCLAHQSEADDSKPLVDDSDYPVSRPVYVELERKKKKFVPRQDVRLMVGSLTVESIGEFVPDVSDQENTILPCEFYCTRLYWSSLEPWRVVKYHIRTKVIHSTLEYSTENDFNYTVDHSLDDHVIPKNGEKLLPAKEVVIREVNENDVRQVLENIIEIICSREDEGCLSDPQNSADLLPPELKDAIFEDIPHDLLDGISMQDIFPKLMSYDDISVDTKGDKEYKSDSNSDIESLHTYSSKKTKYDSYENSVENNLYKNLNHATKTYSVQSEEKRKYSKRYFNRRRNCDRSSNELISEGNAENKIEEKENTVKWQRPQILQVDGAGDCSSESDTGSPSNEDLSCTPVLHVTIQESQHTAGKISSPIGISSKSEHCIWQVDGTADFSSSSSSSESGSPLREEDCNWKLIEQLDGQVDCSSSEEGEEKPVKCAQCHRTYRTAQSYERHLQTCSVDYILSCSESDSSEEEKINSPIAEVVENDILAPNTLYTVSEAKSVSEDGSLQMSLPEIRECAPTLPETVSDCKMDINCIPFGTLYSQVDEMQTTAYPENSESQNCRNGNDISDNFTNVNCVYSEQNCHKINGLIHSNVETIVTNNALPNRICQYKPKTIRTVSENFEYSNGASLSLSPKTSPIRNRTPRTYTRRKKGITTVTPVITSPVTTSQHQIIEYQPTAVSGAPALILHQVPTQNVIPAYVDASYTQQSSAHNIQYIATIDPQDKTQYLAANPIIPATYHLQTTPLGIQSVVPTVVGTIIQPNGVEQLVVNAPTPAVEVISQNPTSGMFIASPPMYVGMETVVSNTVMSSSQFVSGMLAASSYSATTTQVFQTAKPVMDLAQGYVIVNTQPSPVPTAIPQAQTMFQPPAQTPFPWSCNYQEAYKFKERTTYQAVTRQIIREEKKVDCLQMVNATQKTIVIEQPVSEKVEIKSEPPRFAEQKSPVHELSKMVDNFCVKKQVTTQKRKCTGVSLDIVKCPPVAAQVNQKVFNEVSQNVSKPLCGDSKKNPIVMKEITLPPVLALKQEKLKTEPNKTESENKEVNGKKQTHSEVLNKNNNERNTSQITLKTNKYIEMSRFPLRENKIIKRTLELKPRKINTLVKNSSSPKIIYEINSQDGFTTSSSCLVEAWQKVFEAVQAARAEKRLPPLPQNPFVSDLRTLGLDNNSVKYLVEQLPGVGHCVKYKPVYHKPRIPVLGDHMAAPQENVTGCARSEPFRIRNKYDMFSWLASRHRRPPKLLVNSDSDIVNGNSRRATSLNLPMAMRFRHLKETSRESVGVFRSDIHGRGLFCLRDIDSGEMVIEYAGEVVRSGLTDKRERYYTSKGIGCYMFRIDDQFVVDATMRGNAARFINHSCEPNCYSRVVDILGKKHILIFALRRIPQGEELTYDYKFPLEDDKITCHCLSRKCRKYLN